MSAACQGVLLLSPQFFYIDLKNAETWDWNLLKKFLYLLYYFCIIFDVANSRNVSIKCRKLLSVLRFYKFVNLLVKLQVTQTINRLTVHVYTGYLQ